ncbi:hypothetical protein GCM10027586_06260 [Kineococcus gypseus]|uniref:hypothetical protein n=1 Tax=Kineococcus gypseus TaxID=1637102 RepID=UPI003D7F04BB
MTDEHTNGMWDHLTPDLRNKLLAANGHVVNVSTDELREDIDGLPLSVERVDHGPATLHVPGLDHDDS